MAPRDDLFAVLNGQPPEHLPVWLLFPYHPTSYYVDVRNHPRYRPLHELSLEYAVTLNRRNLSTSLHTPEVTHAKESTAEGAEGVTHREPLIWKDVQLTREVRVTPYGTRIKPLIDTEEDLEAYCSLPVETDPARIHAQLESQLPHYLREKAEFPEHAGAMMLDLGEPIGPLYHSANLEEYAIWSLTHNGLVRDFLERVMEQKRIVYRFCLERDLADIYFLVGSELASPPLVSRQTFQQWIVPYATELIAMIHAFGKKAIQHYHGQIRDILPDFLLMKPDALHTIEAPPVGNCTLTQAFDIVGDQIALIGNIQYDEFRSLDEKGMAEAVRKVLEETQGRRFILSPTAGPFDPDVPDRVLRNYEMFMKSAQPFSRGMRI